MKTFSNMCNPDKQLTRESYSRAVSNFILERNSLRRDKNYQSKFIELSKKIERLTELQDAIEVELQASVIS